MTGAAQRAALDAVHSARPIVARLNIARDKEDLAADIIEAWGAVETGLRSLVGGSALTGQLLIRELRQRQFLTLEQANALAEFHAARDRAGRTDYLPTEGDVNSVREAFLKLESGLMGESVGASASPAATVPRVMEPAAVPVAAHASTPVNARPAWMIPVLGAVGLGVVVGLAWYVLAGRGGSAAYDDGVAAYREGRREAAIGSFRKAAADNPDDPMPHVYIARIEREQGNMSNANAEAVAAVKLGPENGDALRELAATLFAVQNFDGARTFYIRAIKADSTDRVAQGFLGCSLVRLGRPDEGARWIARAGTGAWTACMPGQQQPGYAPQQAIPGAPRP